MPLWQLKVSQEDLPHHSFFFLCASHQRGVLAQHLTLPPSFEQRGQPLQIYSKQGTSGFVVSWEPLLAAKE